MGQKPIITTPKYKLRDVYVLREHKIDAKKIRKGDVFRFAPLNDTDIQINDKEWFYAEARPVPNPMGYDVRGNLEFKCKILIPPKLGKVLNFIWPKPKRRSS